MYGPTETTVWSTVRHVRAEEDLRDIGKPILNTRIYFVNQQGDLLPVQSCYDQEVEVQIQKWSQHLGKPAWLERMVRHNLTIFDGHRIRHKVQGKILALEAEHQVSEIISHPNPGMAGWERQTSGAFTHQFISGGHHEVLDEKQLPILVQHIQLYL